MFTQIVRGSTVVFTVGFLDAAGAAINPASANLYINYKAAGVPTTATIALSQNVNTWTASWDSSIADRGRADWHIRSAGSNKAALEGTLLLEINRANP